MIIWKYVIKTDNQIIDIPSNSFSILSIQIQNDEVVLWVCFSDTNNGLSKICIMSVVTGGTFNSMLMRYIGTLQFSNGNYILHYFYRNV